MKSSRLILLFSLPFLSGFFSAVSFAQSISFTAVTNSAAGDGPSSVAVGDFNGDGKQDLAVANRLSNNVSILLGNGNGTFFAATNVAAGINPASVAIGDFNGDRRQDLAVANSNSDNVSILLGIGNGTFVAATNFAAGISPVSVAIGDFNGDGRQDLAVANQLSSNVSILLGNGNGTFVAATNFAAGTNPVSVAIGDFNGDGRQDLAVANFISNNVSILLGNGNGTFVAATNFAAGISPVSVAVADFNGDGRQDLAVANSNSDNVSILLNATRFSGAPVDFDGDGNLILAGGVETGDLSRGPAFQLFNASGVLQTTQFALNADFRADLSFVLGNFNADGTDEVLLVGGRETSGLARGPAYQLFGGEGTFKFTRFVLNPDFSNVSFSSLNVGSNGVLVCGLEISGLARGPAYQAFDTNGNLVRTQFVLNPDFTVDNSCIGINLDGVAGDEVITGGREVTGLARGPAFQVFGSDGSFRLTRFVLNPDFSETKFSILDVGGSKNIAVSGRETSGVGRGPAFQLFDASGNFILTRFVLNPNFTDFQVFGANTTNAVTGEEIVTGGVETSGIARGPAIQVWDKNGNHLFTRFVLNPDFTEVTFSKIDINNDGVDEILVVGRETKGLARGPAFQLFDGNGNHLVTRFVLNTDFTNLRFFAVDQNGDGDKEIGIGGIEISGQGRGPAYQIFESDGALLQTRFVLNPDF
jgi:hypothetical protein